MEASQNRCAPGSWFRSQVGRAGRARGNYHVSNGHNVHLRWLEEVFQCVRGLHHLPHELLLVVFGKFRDFLGPLPPWNEDQPARIARVVHHVHRAELPLAHDVLAVRQLGPHLEPLFRLYRSHSSISSQSKGGGGQDFVWGGSSARARPGLSRSLGREPAFRSWLSV